MKRVESVINTYCCQTTDWLPALLSVSLSTDELYPELQKKGGVNRRPHTIMSGRVVSDLSTEKMCRGILYLV